MGLVTLQSCHEATFDHVCAAGVAGSGRLHGDTSPDTAAAWNTAGPDGSTDTGDAGSELPECTLSGALGRPDRDLGVC